MSISRPREPTQPPAAVRRLKIAIAASLVAGLAISPKLWVSDRFYPLTPVARFLPPIPSPLDQVLFLALLATVAAVVFLRRPGKLIGLTALLAIIMVLFDQSRLQPWFYQYVVMLVAVGLYDRGGGEYDDDRHPALNTCRLVMVCTYFWSGLQKMQPDFAKFVFPWMVEPFTRLLPHSMAVIVNQAGVVAPLLETAIGIGLLTRRFRRLAIVAAVGMHAFILLSLGPLGNSYNSVVWPWNIAMVTFLAILFWARPNLRFRDIVWTPGGVYRIIVLLLFGIMPILSFFNAWDSLLSLALFAPRRYVSQLFITDTLALRLPQEIRMQAQPFVQPGIHDFRSIDIYAWSLDELNVVVYPEPRIYKNLARNLCVYLHQPPQLKLLIIRRPTLFSGSEVAWYDCAALSR